MVVRLRKRMDNVEDLTAFESSLHRLYNTTSGVYCQALLTTAYLKWSKELRSHLHLKLNFDVHRELWQENIDQHFELNDKKLIETYLPGFRIVYCDNECTVHQILPHQCNTNNLHVSLKRKLNSLQEDELDTNKTSSV